MQLAYVYLLWHDGCYISFIYFMEKRLIYYIQLSKLLYFLQRISLDIEKVTKFN